MKSLLTLWALAACVCAQDSDEVQSMKRVLTVKGKGGSLRYIYKGGENIGRFYNARTLNLTKHTEEVPIGVCYVEIPTANLVSDQSNIPAGNGSRPDLSRIRTCCNGFARNIHDFTVCDPICSKGCVNALCVTPETCQCYPDFVKNTAGVCTATCPIGCQNGQCAGASCVCNSGYILDSEGKYCMPSCNDKCGKLGNCTAPNKCSCQPGYQSTPNGSCKPVCQDCKDGEECTAPNTCSCRAGYVKDVNGCKPHCTPACQHNTNCIAPNVCSQPPASDNSLQNNNYGSHNNDGSLLLVKPLYAENQEDILSHPFINPNQYPSTYKPMYPQGPYNQQAGNNQNYFPQNKSNTSHDISLDRDGQIQQHPDNSFYPYQGPSSFPHPNGQNPQQGILPNNTNPTQQRPDQGPNQQPNRYPGLEIYPERNTSSLHPHRGDIETDQGSMYYSGGRQQNITLNAMNQYGSGSHASSNQETYGYGQTHQGNYNRSQQESHDFRNQGTFDSRQHKSFNTSNQRSYDSSQQHSFATSQNGHEYDTQYTQNNYGNFNRDTQNSSAQHQSGNSNQDIQSSSNHGTYESSQYGAYNSSGQEIKHSTNERNFDSQQGSYRPNQGPYQNSPRDQRNNGSQQGSFDSPRRDNQSFTNEENNDSRRETYNPNQGQYPFYYREKPRQMPEVFDQVSNHTATDSFRHTSMQEVYNKFDTDQQTINVPVCSKACINSYCVEGDQCKCKPGYISDRTNPNICQPHCPGGCPNGVCSAPHLCLCNAGYYKDTSIKGRQVCVKNNRNDKYF